MTNITIPAASIEAMRVALAKGKPVREVAIAMLTAWPGAHGANQIGGVTTPLTLPFPPQENPDE